MSTWAVWGMTRPKADEMAKKAVDRKLLRQKKVVSESEWMELVSEESEKIFKSGESVLLSEKFDSPSFAVEWRDLARRTTDCNSLQIRAYVKHEVPGQKIKLKWEDWHV